MKKIIFWSMASYGVGISGGDRIYIEFAKRWSKKYPITIVTWEEGIAMIARNNLIESPNILFHHLSIPKLFQSNFVLCYLYRIVKSIYASLFLNIDNPKSTYIYSSSEFWMDSLPCFILKLRYPSLIWVATWFQTAPSPLSRFSFGRLLWLSQLPIKPLIHYFADFILVNNDIEKQIFPHKKTLVVLGAVNTQQIDAYRAQHPSPKKHYAAVFQGRFHPQKGAVELIAIWKQVVVQKPKARLAMIGDGQLMPVVDDQIKKLGLEKNIDLFGYVFDGPQKYKIFSQSQMAVHPAFFDSGGMATAEAMGFSIPAIGFNLPSYDSYYPKGMIKVPTGNLSAFATAIEDLLDHPAKLDSLGRLSGKFIHESYSWDYRSSQILRQIVERTDREKNKVKPLIQQSTAPTRSKGKT